LSGDDFVPMFTYLQRNRSQHLCTPRKRAGQPGPQAENREWGPMDARRPLAARDDVCDARRNTATARPVSSTWPIPPAEPSGSEARAGPLLTTPPSTFGAATGTCRSPCPAAAARSSCSGLTSTSPLHYFPQNPRKAFHRDHQHKTSDTGRVARKRGWHRELLRRVDSRRPGSSSNPGDGMTLDDANDAGKTLGVYSLSQSFRGDLANGGA